jgi:Protein of unknown function (DUF2384)
MTHVDIPEKDLLGFGLGSAFQPKLVSDWLELSKIDVARATAASSKSVRYGADAPTVMRDQLEEIALTCNRVAQAFRGDTEKTAVWFKSRNPMLGNVSPRDMIRLGRFDRLRKFVISATSCQSLGLVHAA